ncbi:MAG: hypothetical protein IEMM0002_0369 [bacterium]|nr:MAG: hypothetical protein IEMM0002_0369 [bacterium]
MKKRKKRKKSVQKKNRIERLLVPLTVIAGALLAAIFLPKFYTYIHSTNTPSPQGITTTHVTPPVKKTAPEQKVASIPPEIVEDIIPQSSPPQPRVAILIDDVGLKIRPVKKLLELEIPFTFAVLPGQPHSVDVARMINNAGYEIILHLPMEPENRSLHDPGKGALMLSQPEDEIRATVKKLIAATPGVVGMNNHMGSLFTKNEEKMRIVLEEVKEAGLYFIDSYTTPESVALETARAMGVKSAARKVFLDNERDGQKIKSAIRRTMKVARRDGAVIAICHPYPETIKALSEMKHFIQQTSGVEPMFASSLVH